MGDRPFLSIGEVLDLLKGEYPDVTISKIRFLESQGLLDPERTPSGYRKFYEADVERLRWILEQQREHFLPLKVIKERIANPEPVPSPPEPAQMRLTPDLPGSGEAAPNGAPAPAAELEAPPAASLSATELAAACGLEVGAVQELDRYGLLHGRAINGQTYYDEDALVIARLAATMARHGVEARHLRMFKTAAEREASTYEQIVLPLLKQRNPIARQRAAETIDELTRTGEGLRAALVRAALRPHTSG